MILRGNVIKRFIFFQTLIFNTFLVINSQNSQFCHDIEKNSQIILECNNLASRFYFKTTQIAEDSTSEKYQVNFDDEGNPTKKFLEIKKVDKYDSGDDTYYTATGPQTNLTIRCKYDIQVYNTKKYHKGSFSINELPNQEFSETVTTQNENKIPELEVNNPNNFNINITYQMKALLINELIINVNNQINKYNDKCNIDNDPLNNCLEINNETLNILNNNNDMNGCPNNDIELKFDYSINDRLECNANKLDPFNYKFRINYGVRNVNLNSNLNDDNIKLNEIGEFKCNVDCANPNDFTYYWSLNKTLIDDTFEINEKIQEINSTSKTDLFYYLCDNEFKTLIISCCVKNGFGKLKCETKEVKYLVKTTITTTSGKNGLSTVAIIGIALGTFMFLIIIIIIIVNNKFRRKTKKSSHLQQIELGDGLYMYK